jgi:hypothetical protein
LLLARLQLHQLGCFRLSPLVSAAAGDYHHLLLLLLM